MRWCSTTCACERCSGKMWHLISECIGSAMPPGAAVNLPHTLACLRGIGQTTSGWEDVSAAGSCRRRGHNFLRQVGPKGKCLVIGAKPCERLQGDSWSQQCWGGQVLENASSGGMRGEFIWCYSKPRQRSVLEQHFYSGMVKVSHSSSTWARLPAVALLLLPRDLSVTLK